VFQHGQPDAVRDAVLAHLDENERIAQRALASIPD
jgi:hypothetical protein